MTDFENYLSTVISENYIVQKAMNYSLLAKSKRIRPLILFALLKDFSIEENVGYPAAAALEMIHTYSLIHDDLPAFDNDMYRRGQLSNHAKFGESTAILAGDALLTDAFDLICKSEYTDAQKVALIHLLSFYAGSNGMIKGQSLDMEFETRSVTLDELFEMDSLKTSRLITLPMQMALVLSGNEDQKDLFERAGHHLGIAFQIQDDILDIESSKEITGKSSSDDNNNKSTYIKLMSLEGAKEKVNELFEEIGAMLKNDYPNLTELIGKIEKRNW